MGLEMMDVNPAHVQDCKHELGQLAMGTRMARQ